MSSRCKICGPGSTSFRVGDARPDCSGCSTIKEALSGYLKTPDQSISLNYHGEPPYAIQLYDPLGMTMLAWNSQPVTLTVTGSSDRPGSLGLVGPRYDGLGVINSLEGNDPVHGLGNSTGSDRTKDLVQTWLQQCEDNHQNTCWNEQHITPPLPRRVLYVGENDPGKVKLCEDLKINAPYLCLSYRWGAPSENLCTTMDNIQDHKAAIPIGRLPLLFQQFIALTQFLGKSYVWIDALCIIQDNDEDWKSEASKMADIYSNSWLTIAATAAHGPQEALFTERTQKPLSTDDGLSQVQITRHFPHDPKHDTEDAFPLLKRGWVYQERYLPPRVLHFGPDELIWDCHVQRRCECGQNEHLLDDMKKSSFLGALSTTKWKENLKAASKLWRLIVIQYTKLGLTESRDRMIAIDGIAKVMQKARKAALNDVYLLGLWWKTLPIDLLWYREDRQRKHYRTSTPGMDHIPSWSWASFSGPIVYHQALYERMESYEVLGNADSAAKHHAGTQQITLTCPSFTDTYLHIKAQSFQNLGKITWHHDYDDELDFFGKVNIAILAYAPNGFRHTFFALILRAKGHYYSRIGYLELRGADRKRLEQQFQVKTFVVQ